MLFVHFDARSGNRGVDAQELMLHAFKQAQRKRESKREQSSPVLKLREPKFGLLSKLERDQKRRRGRSKAKEERVVVGGVRKKRDARKGGGPRKAEGRSQSKKAGEAVQKGEEDLSHPAIFASLLRACPLHTLLLHDLVKSRSGKLKTKMIRSEFRQWLRDSLGSREVHVLERDYALQESAGKSRSKTTSFTNVNVKLFLQELQEFSFDISPLSPYLCFYYCVALHNPSFHSFPVPVCFYRQERKVGEEEKASPGPDQAGAQL